MLCNKSRHPARKRLSPGEMNRRANNGRLEDDVMVTPLLKINSVWIQFVS